jgi:glycosyltransferase involved in cell wall biosynthesis
MLRIAFLEGSPSLRARHVLPILAKHFRITYITSGDDIPPADYEEVIRFRKAKVFFQNSFWYARAADRLYQQGKIDFVYNYHAIGCFVRKAPQLAFFGGSFAEEFKMASERCRFYARPKLAIGFLHYALPEILTCRRARRVIANSEALRRTLADLHSLPDERTGYIYNGISNEPARAFDGKNERGTEGALFVGRLHWSKGILELLEAFTKRKNMKCTLYVAGDGPQTTQVKRMAAGDQRIVLLGHQTPDRIFTLMSHTKYFLFPSLREGFPNALAEAMASGHACLYYDIAPSKELAGDTGVAIPTGNPSRMLDELEKLMEDPKRANNLSQRAHERARLFSWEKCTTDLIAEFQRFPWS